ncbi:tryptophanase [Shewanella surugensis]|uniref:Tryptophanase n=1 Tax=Shewanella surugensis TaxID=212020 RepID=A0ABT0LIY5_9GAMM|nr:tryptophanase [Shewanella surugensis]MCL1127554.1 tryptophanase [Shewanella surugensis]
MRTIIEPFRIKMTEPIKIISKEERIEKLKKAHYNVFLLDAIDCTIDLLTDSGTGAMSAQQWAAIMIGDESYAGSQSWKKFEATIKKITAIKHIFPTHQGRAAEGLLAMSRLKAGDMIPNNSHFDTTRANIEFAGATAVNLLCEEGRDPSIEAPFKGNMDIEKLTSFIQTHGAENIPFAMLTITNNTGGGQPVSLANIRAVKTVLSQYNIPLVLDACRFAENAYFISKREKGYQDKSLLEIAQEIFSLADAATMSLKKDGLANIGGFFICNNDEWAEDFKNLLILREGFPTYGGLAGRDLEAISVGLMEALDMDYQTYRHATVDYLTQKLDMKGIPVIKPSGGHAVFIDAKTFMPHIPPLAYPGIALINALYIEGGIRAVELGTVMFGHFDDKGKEQPSELELVRLAFPRRVYTQSHFDYIIEVVEKVWEERHTYSGLNITKQPQMLRHFSCHFENNT